MSWDVFQLVSNVGFAIVVAIALLARAAKQQDQERKLIDDLQKFTQTTLLNQIEKAHNSLDRNAVAMEKLAEIAKRLEDFLEKSGR